jgi:hypothetical protein
MVKGDVCGWVVGEWRTGVDRNEVIQRPGALAGRVRVVSPDTT